ncbi:MAG: PAS domain S-box protein [Caldilineaceae bacterium]|nr:PAS domain S-box protein [Caldilineaceae bacterium]
MPSIAALLRPPRFDDEQANNQASILHAILLTLLVIVTVYMFLAPALFYPGNRSIYLISLVQIGVLLGLLFLAHRGWTRLTSWLLCIGIELLLLLALFLSGGLRGTGYYSHITLVLIVGLLLGGWQALAAAAVSVLAGLLAWYAAAAGLTPHPAFQSSELAIWSEVTLNILAAAIFLLVWDRSSQQARDRARHERVAAEEALRSSEARYRAIVESTDDFICRFRPDTSLTFVNEAYCRYFGRSREDLIGRPFLNLIPQEEYETIRAYLQELLRDDKAVIYEHQVMTPGGELRWQQWTDHPIVDADGRVYELQSVGRDINERHEAEKYLQESLHEKEVMLREIHHRVKNNLQIVSSLLKLQAAHLSDEAAQAIFADSHSRINSMALIHERLYRSGDLARIDFAAYARELLTHLFRMHGAASRGIGYALEIPQTQMRVDQAIPCGLIVNELVTNSLKHAFPDSQVGQVTIILQVTDGGVYRLTVSDTGRGLPAGLDIGRTESLGLQLVYTLTAQLEGRLELLPGPGANFCITFSRNGE